MLETYKILGYFCLILLILLYRPLWISNSKKTKQFRQHHKTIGILLFILAFFHGKLAMKKPDIAAMFLFILFLLMPLGYAITKHKYRIFKCSHLLISICILIFTILHIYISFMIS